MQKEKYEARGESELGCVMMSLLTQLMAVDMLTAHSAGSAPLPTVLPPFLHSESPRPLGRFHFFLNCCRHCVLRYSAGRKRRSHRRTVPLCWSKSKDTNLNGPLLPVSLFHLPKDDPQPEEDPFKVMET